MKTVKSRIAGLTFLALAPCVVEGATTSYVCEFDVSASPDGLSDSPLAISFVVDHETRKSYLMGNVGAADVMMVPQNEGVSFVEVTESRNVMTTSITSTGDAVHSRNGIFSGKLIPSQSYGKCKQW